MGEKGYDLTQIPGGEKSINIQKISDHLQEPEAEDRLSYLLICTHFI